MKNKIVITLLLVLSALAFTINAQAGNSLMMATTTSTDNTGLLDKLIPEFIKDTSIQMKWVSTGTGKALKLGQNCDVDVLLVHAPPAEKKYIAAGYGKDRREVMYNDFVIIGPKNDPAAIKGKDISEAMMTIKNKKASFISRGDDSGTNKKEKLIWKNAGIAPPEKEKWYVQTGQGMLATINVAQEKNGYTMTDRGTYIKYQHQNNDKAPLTILIEGDSILLNQYSVLTLNPNNCANTKYDLAVKFSEWMASPKAQNLIKDFKLKGKKLFIPNAK